MRMAVTQTVLTMLTAVWLLACNLAQSDSVTTKATAPSRGVQALELDAAIAMPAADGATEAATIADAAVADRPTPPDARAAIVADTASLTEDVQRRRGCVDGGFVFCEDFHHGTGAWRESGGRWTLIEDDDPPEAIAGYGPTLAVASAAYVPSFEWSDMTAEARLRITSFGQASSTNRAEIFARYQGSSHTYALALRSDGKLGLRKNGAAIGTPANVAVGENHWHTLRIRVAGAPGAVLLEGYLDGVLLVTAADSGAGDASASGTVAVGVYGVTLAVFSDVRVSLP